MTEYETKLQHAKIVLGTVGIVLGLIFGITVISLLSSIASKI